MHHTLFYQWADACAYRDAPTSNYTPSASTTKPPKSTKPFHRRARPSIDKSQVSKPFPILAHDEKDLFEAIASNSVQTRAQRIPKAAEKKVKIDASGSIKQSPQPKPKASADKSSQSWYTRETAQPPTTGAPLQRSVSNATPRTITPKVDVTRANSTRESRNRGRTELEGRRDGVGTMKRHVPKSSIKHRDCPWVDPTNNPTTQRTHPTQRPPVCPATRGSYGSDKTVVEDGTPMRADAEKQGELVRSVQETLRPTVRLISKPLPNLPNFDSVSSKWSASTGSVYSNDDPSSYDKVLDMFPQPPEGVPKLVRFDDWQNSNSLSTPPVFMSCPNTSSSSIATTTSTAASDSTVKPLTLKAVPKPKVATVVHQISRANRSYTQLQDSIVIRKGRAQPHGSMKGSIHTPPIRTTGAAPTLRQRSSSLTPSQSQSPPKRAANLHDLIWPNRHRTAEDIERDERERLERERKYQIEEQEKQERALFDMEFGFNPEYKGTRMYQREVGPNGFELIKDGKNKRKWL